MKRRGAARVLGVDFDDDYLAQARFAAGVNGLEIEFRKLSVYDVGALGERFDVVLFMGVLYHLRHPLLALDLIHEHVADDLLVFQSMQRGAKEIDELEQKIGQLVVKTLALRQPMAQDLRHVVASLKIASDLERIGDYAANVGKRAIALSQMAPMKPVSGRVDTA